MTLHRDGVADVEEFPLPRSPAVDVFSSYDGRQYWSRQFLAVLEEKSMVDVVGIGRGLKSDLNASYRLGSRRVLLLAVEAL